MKRYNPKEIEPRWQKTWEESKIYQASEDTSKPKKYILEYFPYPSGAAMHVGHVRNYTIGDVLARFARMNGYNVLHPMGWDAFGLPAENYAIKNNISPKQAIRENTGKFKQQLMQMGFSYDWSREIDSSDPDYYKWTQWFFTLLFQRGLAYRKESIVNWDPVDKTVLANEQVVNGIADRSGAKVERIPLAQWFFKITDYADRLADDLEDLDWSDSIKSMQRNWIGKSVGAEIDFKVKQPELQSESSYVDALTVFTTRPDTLYGVTFLVVAPEHKYALDLATPEKYNEVNDYIYAAVSKTEIERMEQKRTKTGVFTGSYGIHPLTGAKLKIYIADYVLGRYGTGAIMAVPAHDQRDHDFALLEDLDVIRVVEPLENSPELSNSVVAEAKSGQPSLERTKQLTAEAIKEGRLVFDGEGTMINSDEFNGQSSSEARESIVKKIVTLDAGAERTNYRISDWLISRQRYWGAPIPMVWVEKTALNDSKADFVIDALKQNQTKEEDGKTLIAVPVPQSQLPVVLPEVDSYQPDGSGKGPLARQEDWVHVWMNLETGETVSHSNDQPKTGDWAEGWRETDTMDGFACSSWYFLRFADPHNDKVAFDPEKIKFWLPVDDYIGGAEHAVMHLLYARMWTKVLFDVGIVDFNEPFKTLRNQGMILAPDGRKMSKSWGNVIAPDEIIEQGYGADAIRIMELFIGPWNQSAAWSVEGMGGCFRFLQRVWTLAQEYKDAKQSDAKENKAILAAVHKTIKKTSQDMEDLGFNTSIAALMELVNDLYKIKAKDGFESESWKFAIETLLRLLAPFAPHMTEELWHELGNKTSIHTSEWPKWDEKYLVADSVTFVVQVNGKVRAQLEMPVDSTEDEVVKAAQANEKVAGYLNDATIRKTIFVPNKLVSFVVG